YIPFAGTFNLNSTYTDPATGTTKNGHTDGMYYIMPGIKLYPTGNNGYVKYSVGPSIVWGTGEKSSANYDPYGNGVYKTETHTVLGMIVNNTLNINPTQHIFLALEFGFGFTYLDQVGGLNQSTAGLVQGGFKMGYRF